MELRFEQVVALPREAVFAFHEDPEHLVRLHRGWAAFRLLHHDGGVAPGSRTWFEITVAGIVPVVLGFEHTVYEPPLRFGERLIHGPFRKFSHTHEFEDGAAGKTVVRDLLDVELPWYYGGEPAMRLIVGPLLRRAFGLRGAALLRLAQTDGMARSAGSLLP